jgi:hemolysin activation/secretion protein
MAGGRTAPGVARWSLALSGVVAGLAALVAGGAVADPFAEIRSSQPPVPVEVIPHGSFGQDTLPPLPESLQRPGTLATSDRIAVREIRVEGSTVFSQAELDDITRPYTGRIVTLDELLAVRTTLTHLYVDRGYTTSGAVLPDQPVGDGVITYRIVEGRLTDVTLKGTRYFAESYIADRVRLAAGVPVNLKDLQGKLQTLLQNPLIRSIHADLRPGLHPGDGILDITVEENNPLEAGLSYDNGGTPGTGAYRKGASAADHNVIGYGDSLSVNVDELSGEHGANDFALSYTLPFTPWDTTLALGTSRTRSQVIVPPFDRLDITNVSRSYTATLTQPVYRDSEDELTVGLVGERRKTDSTLLGFGFSFDQGPHDGETLVHTLGLELNYVHRDLEQVVALRSSLTRGFGFLDSTENTTGPDGRFLTWLGQAQYARHLGWLDSDLLLRSDLRLADRTLLSSERFALGGMDTVRGYREALLTRDNGWASSAELRIPTTVRLPVPWLSDDEKDGMVSLAPFFDYGRSWNCIAEYGDLPRQLYSIGLGLVWRINDKSDVSIYYGHGLEAVALPKQNRDLQDYGLNFSVNLVAF